MSVTRLIRPGYETTVTATDITRRPASEGDTEITVSVMRSVVFLAIYRDGQLIAHADMTPADWQALAATPRAGTGNQDAE